MTMQTMALVAAISAHLLAVAHVLDRVKWIYTWLPEKVRPLLLGLLAGLPPLAESLASARSGEAIALAVASGVTAFFMAYKGKTPPPSSGDGQAAHVLLGEPDDRARISNDKPEPAAMSTWRHPAWRLALVCLALAGCARLAKIDWSQVVNCAEQPAEATLTQIVSSVLAGTGDVKTELESAAAEYGPGVVKCTVQQLLDQLDAAPRTARVSRQVARGRAFLAKVQR